MDKGVGMIRMLRNKIADAKMERQERDAAIAQMTTVKQERANAELRMKESNQSIDREWEEKQKSLVKACQDKDKAVSIARDRIVELEAEHSTHEASTQMNTLDEVGRLKGQVNVLKRQLKLKSEEGKSQSIEMVNKDKLHELEAKIRDGEAERRR